MEAMLLGNQTQVLFVSGLGGIGKTSLATKFAKDFCTFYTGGVYIFNAQSKLSFRQSLKLNIEEVTGNESVDSNLELEFTFFIRKLTQAGNVLFVYDSCDSLKVIEKLIPTENKEIRVVVTTRMRDGNEMLTNNPDSILHLNVLELDAAVELLLASKRRLQSVHSIDDDAEEKTSARGLVDRPEIGRLPLAILHAGIYLKETELTCDEYGELLANKSEKLQAIGDDLNEILKYCGLLHLVGTLESESIDTVDKFAAFNLSQLQTSSLITQHDLEQLNKMKQKLKLPKVTIMTWDLQIEERMNSNDTASITVLEIASLLDGRVIAKDFLSKLALNEDGSNLDRNRKVTQAIFRLFKLSLLNDDMECSMHSLVQQSVIETMTRYGTFDRRLRLVCERLLGILPKVSDDIIKHLNGTRMINGFAHVYSVSDHVLRSQQKDEKCWELVHKSCLVALSYQHLEDAKRLCEGELALVERLPIGTNNTIRLTYALLNVGKVHLDWGNSQEARDPLKKALQLIKKENIQIESTLFYTALNLLGQCCRDLGDFEQSEYVYLELLQFSEQQTLSNDYIFTVLNNVALTYHRWGNISAAVANYKRGLTLIREQANVSQLSIAKTLTNLASCYQQSGRLDQALSHYEKALSISKKELPSSHPFVAFVMRHLSSCYRGHGQMDRALELANQSLNVASLTLPRNHPDLGWHFYEMGECYRHRESTNESLRFYEKAYISHSLWPTMKWDR
ncbi:uncharacterized protein LOC134186880 isoform X2 [Corticium candelabrum]|uniref:uncharacterized protein LOC134186880 isoform X2 n=1 Tax=Corticium candelabrum TaxID=121492 RepID=UPI002E274436|nr:uncharacterized protein LOC134186880 isoform X2 [Corticium candelabrum]